jgi:membrane protein YdbS with pleckstrin-like domain
MDLNISSIYNDSVAAFNVLRDNIVTVVAPAAILVHDLVTVHVVNMASRSNSWRYSIVREDVGSIHGHQRPAGQFYADT